LDISGIGDFIRAAAYIIIPDIPTMVVLKIGLDVFFFSNRAILT
jgi:hypothetical protein